MQIHELTRRRPIKEAGTGALGALGKAAMSAASNAVYGQDVTSSGFAGDASADRRLGASQQNAALIEPLAKQLSTGWSQTVAAELKDAVDADGAGGATSVTQLDATSQNGLKAKLAAMVNKMVYPQSSGNYTNLPATAGMTPEDKAEAENAVKAIDMGTEAVWRTTVSPTPDTKATMAAFTAMVRDGILPAQNIARFVLGQRGKTGAAAMPVSGSAKQAATDMDLDQAEIKAMQAYFAKNGGVLTPGAKELFGLK
jgi:hypothetical protein